MHAMTVDALARKPYRTLGPRRFRAELAKLNRVSIGFAGTAGPKP
jgi:hypothetical protein